jgi:hypothetical protein
MRRGGDQLSPANDASSSAERYMQEWMVFSTSHWQAVGPFFMWRRANAGFNVFGQDLINIFPRRVTKPCPEPEALSRTLNHAGVVCGARTILSTESGRVGVGPSLVRPGDRIYIVLGCDHPLIMRPKGDGGLQVVGSCFIDGYMLGEAARKIQKPGEVEWLSIV